MFKFLILIFTTLGSTRGAVENIDFDPTNSYGIEVGELSFPQLILSVLTMLLIVILYATGVLPVEIDLGAKFYGDGVDGRVRRDVQASGKLRVGPSFLLECPLQFVCEVDDWAHRDHDGLLESLVALWFRNPDKRWRRPEAAVFSGVGSCREMHPCPFDVQDAMGFRIPGAHHQDPLPLAFLSAPPCASPYVDPAAPVTPCSVLL